MEIKSGQNDYGVGIGQDLVMSDAVFRHLSSFIYENLGINLGEGKRIMLQSRLMKRIRKLGLASYEDYAAYLFSSSGQEDELGQFVHAVTTNKTDFFREPQHFTFLLEQAIPLLFREKVCSSGRPLRIWSSACSTGEEPYTLAMALDGYCQRNQGFSYQVLASDISVKVLEEARKGIYEERRIEPVPVGMRRQYLLRSKDRASRLVRIVPELRKRVEFRRINLKEPQLGDEEQMEVIFCRNVIIYFDRPTQELVVNNLCRHLRPGGFLFMGHSETLNGLRVPLLQSAPTIYQKHDAR